MAENVLATVYLRTRGIPHDWLAGLARTLVTDRLAADADVSVRTDADSGSDVLACLHTRSRHIAAIRRAAEPVAGLRAYPLECHDDFRSWVLDRTDP